MEIRYMKERLVEGSHQEKNTSKGPGQKCWTVLGQAKGPLSGSYAKLLSTQFEQTAIGSQGMGKRSTSRNATFQDNHLVPRSQVWFLLLNGLVSRGSSPFLTSLSGTRRGSGSAGRSYFLQLIWLMQQHPFSPLFMACPQRELQQRIALDGENLDSILLKKDIKT